MKELWLVAVSVAICCIRAYALPALNPLAKDPLANWSPESDVNPEEMGLFLEGDMDITADFRNGMVDEKYRWPNGTVPYHIVGDFEEKHLAKLQRAFETYFNVTNGCIRFIPRTDEDAYIKIKSEHSGCHSTVGYHGGGQTVNLATKGCFSKFGVVLHELYHALGFQHEQSRFDRDEYVTINWENLKDGGNGNLKLMEEDIATGFGLPYDYDSVMHYSRHAFHDDSGEETITPVDPDAHIGQRNNLSAIDIGKLMKMYKCDENQETPMLLLTDLDI